MDTVGTMSTPDDWRKAFLVLSSLELGRAAIWRGPDDLEELKIRVETLATLLGLVSRIDLGRLDDVVVHLAHKHSLTTHPDVPSVRAGVRALLSERSYRRDVNDEYLERAAAVVRSGIAAVSDTKAKLDRQDRDQQDFDSCRIGMQAWFRQLRDEDRWKFVRLFGIEGVQVAIDEVFVELFAVADQDVAPSAGGRTDHIRRGLGRINVETHAAIDAASMVARTTDFCVAVGDPGSGKSTLVQWLARAAAFGRLADYEAAFVVKLASFADAIGRSPGLTLLEHFFRELGEPSIDCRGLRTGHEKLPMRGHVTSYCLTDGMRSRALSVTSCNA